MSDLIKREDAIKALYKYSFVSKDVIEKEINAIPSADTDISEYSDRLWKNAYERGKADRPQGEWVRDDDYHRCSNCHCVAPLDGDEYWMRDKIREDLTEICPNCGARMIAKGINVPNKKGAEDEY